LLPEPICLLPERSLPLRFLLSILCCFFLLATPAVAAVEIARSGQPRVTIGDVYLRDGIPYLSIDEVLAALQLEGRWDSVEHVYRIKTPRGTAIISPGSHFLRLGDIYQPLPDLPRFIDNRLRVPEDFVRSRIPQLLGEAIYYRNLKPASVSADQEESPLDRLFAFVTRKQRVNRNEPILRGIALDPGHGGTDAGCIGSGGNMEKRVALDVSRRLEKLLKMRLGIPVYLSRDGDYTLDLRQRLAPAGRPDADALVLLHAQASLSPAVHGATLIIRPREEQQGGSLETGEGGSIRLARQLVQALRDAGLVVNGIVRAPLPSLGRGNLPSVLVELGYLSNSEDSALLGEQAGQERLAEALYAGIQKFAEEEKKEARQ